MNASFADRKFAEAFAFVSEIIAVLRSGSGTCWVGYFERLASCLAARDVEGAVRARDALPIAGMGGFGEFLEATPQIHVAYRRASEAIGALKVHSRYGIVRENRS
jgi:nitroreductase